MAGRKIHPFDGTYQEKFKHKCGFSIAIIYYLRLLECKWQVKKKVASVKHHSSPMLQSANIPLPLAAPSKPWNMKRAGLLYTTGRVFAGSRSTWTCQGMAMPPTETHDKMTASCGKPCGIFARKTTPRPKPLRQSYLRRNWQITLFPMNFLKLKKHTNFFPSSCLLLRRPEEVSTSKKNMPKKWRSHWCHGVFIECFKHRKTLHETNSHKQPWKNRPTLLPKKGKIHRLQPTSLELFPGANS